MSGGERDGGVDRGGAVEEALMVKCACNERCKEGGSSYSSAAHSPSPLPPNNTASCGSTGEGERNDDELKRYDLMKVAKWKRMLRSEGDEVEWTTTSTRVGGWCSVVW
jgi:hypothetical protein